MATIVEVVENRHRRVFADTLFGFRNMSYHLQAFPILYLNMGGELMYIIEQRLQAQEISADKSSKGWRHNCHLRSMD